MGYTGVYLQSSEEPKQWLKNEFFYGYSKNNNVLEIKINADNGYLLLESKMVDSIYFGTVFLVVFNWSFDKKTRELVYKEMSEFDGAYGNFKVTKAVLNKLTTIEKYNELGISFGYTIEFRERCLNELNRTKKIPLNTIVKTNETIDFNGGISSDLFKIVEKTFWNGKKFVTKKVTVILDINHKELANVKIDLTQYDFELIG